jgi:hypothetical protein
MVSLRAGITSARVTDILAENSRFGNADANPHRDRARSVQPPL